MRALRLFLCIFLYVTCRPLDFFKNRTLRAGAAFYFVSLLPPILDRTLSALSQSRQWHRSWSRRRSEVLLHTIQIVFFCIFVNWCCSKNVLCVPGAFKEGRVQQFSGLILQFQHINVLNFGANYVFMQYYCILFNYLLVLSLLVILWLSFQYLGC